MFGDRKHRGLRFRSLSVTHALDLGDAHTPEHAARHRQEAHAIAQDSAHRSGVAGSGQLLAHGDRVAVRALSGPSPDPWPRRGSQLPASVVVTSGQVRAGTRLMNG